MNIYEAIGTAWVIFTATIASVEILYLAVVGLRTVVKKPQEARASELPDELKEVFKADVRSFR